MVAVYDGIVDGLGVGGSLGGVARIFGGVDELEVVGSHRFPADITVVTVETYGECAGSRQKKKNEKYPKVSCRLLRHFVPRNDALRLVSGSNRGHVHVIASNFLQYTKYGPASTQKDRPTLLRLGGLRNLNLLKSRDFS